MSYTENENKSLYFFSLIFLLLLIPSQLWAFKLGLSADQANALIVIKTRQAKVVMSSPHPDEIFLQFEKVIDVDFQDSFLLKTTTLIDKIESGYDSLLIKAKHGFEMKASQSAQQIILKFIPRPLPASESEKVELYDVSVPLTETRLFTGKGERTLAKDLLHDLKFVAGMHPDVWVSAASNDFQLGRLRRAVEYICTAHRLRPRSKIIENRMDEIECAYAPELFLSYNYLYGGPSLSQVRGEAHAEAWVRKHVKVGAQLEHYFASAHELKLLNGSLGSVYNHNFTGMLYLVHQLWFASEFRGEIYGAKDFFGFGAAYDNWEVDGQTGLRLELFRPYYGSAVLMDQNGARDRIEINQIYSYRNIFQINAAAGLNRYTIPGRDVQFLASSFSGNLDFRYFIPVSWVARIMGPDARASISYILTNEYPYLRAQGERDGPNGRESYNLLDINNYELHTLGVGVEKSWQMRWEVEGYLGVGYSRFSNTWGAVWRAGGFYMPIPCFQTGVTVKSTIATQQISATTYLFEAFARLHY